MIGENESPVSFLPFLAAIHLIARLAEGRSKFFVAVLISMVGLWPSVAVAQSNQNPQSAVDNLMRSSLHVDPATGAMQMQLPLGEYRGRGEASLPITLNYSSKVWNVKLVGTFPCGGAPSSIYSAEYAHGSTSGWTSSLGWFLPVEDLSRETYQKDPYNLPSGAVLLKIARMFVTLPDGSRHELRRDDALHDPTDLPGVYYAVDGSRLRYDTASDTLFMPNGSRYVNYRSGGQNGGQAGSPALQYVDRNGNTLAYNFGASTWTDTLGRSLGVPIPGTPTAGESTYTIPGVNGTPITYTLRWKNLGDRWENLDGPQQVLTDPTETLRYQGDDPASENECVPGNVPTNSLFHSTDAQNRVKQGAIFNPVVLYQIALPNNTNYTFTYNIYGEIDKIVYPTGASEQLIHGVVDPLGGQLDDGPSNQGSRGVYKRTVIGGTIAQVWQYHSVDTLPTGVDPATAPRSVIAPDGTKTVTWYYKSRGNAIIYGFDDARTGMAREERVYDSSGTMIRRSVMQLDKDGPQDPAPGKGYGTATRNARVIKQVDIILDTGDKALAAASEISYDPDLNVTSTRHYDYVAIPQSTAQTGDISAISNGTLLRTEETTYLVNDPAISLSSRTAYRNRSLLSLPTSTRVTDAGGTPTAQTQTSYDETSSYPLLTYSNTPTGWTDPSTDLRGLPTTTGRWLNATDSYLQSHAQYDQFGNLRKTKDANGNESSVAYSAVDQYAYPTTKTSAVPDPTGQSGSNSAFITSTVYDFSTGLVTSETDANGKTTTYDYKDPVSQITDPLNRIKVLTRPDGGTTTYNYGDTPGNLYIETLTSLDATRNIDAYQYFDKLGRPVRGFHNDGVGTTPWSVIDTYYDQMGRVTQVSNPYRVMTNTAGLPDSCAICTTKVYDALGRVLTITTPDGAVFGNAYSGNTSGMLAMTETVTDQAGKKRRSLTDGLGRIIRVDEPDASGNLDTVGGPFQPTNYTYDALDDLTSVIQSVQVRTFGYDSLKRLVTATNPESGTTCYGTISSGPSGQCQANGYDANGNLKTKTDARNVVTRYVYDALNRLQSRTYADGTPAVTYTYDTATNGKGQLSSVSNTLSTSSYTSYDALGRVTGSSQTTDGQSYTMTYGYNLVGGMTSEKYPSGKVVGTEFDAAGRITGVKDQTSPNNNFYYAGDSPSGTNPILYTAHGATSAIRMGNGLWEHAIFNTRLQATEIGLGTGQGGVDRLKLTYDYGTTDNNGNVKSQVIVVPTNVTGFTATQTYSYDQLNRLSAAQEVSDGSSNPAWKQVYVYDRYGNRSLGAGTTLPGQLSNSNNPTIRTSDNRIDRFATNQGSVRYDAAGNLTTDVDNRSFSYNAENLQVSYNGGSLQGGVDYRYDAKGRRVERVTGDTSTIFVYDAIGRLIAEYSNATQPSTGGISYLTADSLGTPRIVTGANGAILARHDYLPFGQELALTGNTPSIRTSAQMYVGDNVTQKFTSKERDIETGLNFFGARYYSGAQGRFTSPDPVNAGARITKPQSWNMYSYVLNNPVSYVDPTGMWDQRTHHWIIQHAFPGLSKAAVNKLIEISDRQDNPAYGGQSQAFAITHMMRGASDKAEDAEHLYRAWSEALTAVAQMLESQYGQPDDTEPALVALQVWGPLAHSEPDGTSPAHAGFQPWVPWKFWLWKKHTSQETFEVFMAHPEFQAAAINAIQQSYRDTFKERLFLLAVTKGCVTTDKVGGGKETICE